MTPPSVRAPADPVTLLFRGLTAAVAGVLVVLAVSVAQALLATQPLAIDFLPLWTAGRFAAHDPARIYDFQALTDAQSWLLGPIRSLRPFAYPPSALLVLAPLSVLPFWWAYAVWMTGTAIAFMTAALAVTPQRPWLAGLLILAPPATVLVFVAGQSSFLIGALGLGALAMLDRRPWLAGVLLGLAAAFKPTLLVMAPLALIAGGSWKALASAALAGVALVAASAVCFGIEPWLAWLAALPRFQVQTLHDTGVLKGVVTPASVAIQLGLDGAMAMALRGLFAVLAIAAVAVTFNRTRDLTLRIVALFGSAFPITPYAMGYDTSLLLPAAVASLLAAGGLRGRIAGMAGYLAAVSAGFPHIGAWGLVIFLAIALGPAALRWIAPPRRPITLPDLGEGLI